MDVPYPKLLGTIIEELTKLDIHEEKGYRCKKRNDGAYILEAISPSGRRKNIVTIWPNLRGGGDIRIVGIGKYEQRCWFDFSDIGTDTFQEDLYMAYCKTQ